jgi:hypothetical protein
MQKAATANRCQSFKNLIKVMKMGISRRKLFKHTALISISYGALLFGAKNAAAQTANTRPGSRPPPSQKKQLFSVKDFGAKGDGRANDYPAIQKAIAALSAAGGGTLSFPQGTYYIDEYKIGGKGTNNITDFTFKQIKGLVVDGNGSKIVLKGGWTRTADYTSGKYTGSYATQVGFLFLGCQNLVIRNLEIDGGAATISKGAERLIEGASHGVLLMGCQHVDLKNLHIHHYCSDGLYISQYASIISSHVAATHCQFTNNGRQGVSIIQLRYATFTDCDFRDTGISGQYGAHSPAAGVDIEPHDRAPKVSDGTGDIQFTNCRFVGNLGFQYVGTSLEKTPYPVTFTSCLFKDTHNQPSHRTCDVLPATKLTRFESCRFENAPLFPSYSISNKANTTQAIRCTFVSDQADQQTLGCLAPGAINVIDSCEFIFNAPAPASNAKYRRIFISNPRTQFLNNRIFISQAEHRDNGATVVAQIYNAQAASGNRWDTDLATPGQYFANIYSGVDAAADSFPRPGAFRPKV